MSFHSYVNGNSQTQGDLFKIHHTIKCLRILEVSLFCLCVKVICGSRTHSLHLYDTKPTDRRCGLQPEEKSAGVSPGGTGHGRAVWLLWLWGWVLLCGLALLRYSLYVQSKSFCPCLRIHFWCQNAFCALRFARVGQWLVAPLVRDAESEVHWINHPPLSSLWQADLSFSASVSHPGQWGKHRAGPALHEHPTHNNIHQGNKAMWVMNSALPHHSMPRIILSSFACLQTEYFVWFSLVLLSLVWVFWWTGFGSGLPFTASACSTGECFPQTGLLEVFLSHWQLGIDVYMS